jgi:hypothetical protein
MWRVAGSALAAVVLVVAVASPSSAAQADSPSVQVEVTVEDLELRIGLVGVTEAIGAIEVELRGVPSLGSPCELRSGFGACSETEGVLRVVALNPTGWSEDTTLLVATLSTTLRDEVSVEVPVLTDVDGVDLPVTATGPEPPPAVDGGGWLVPTGIAVVAVGLVGGVAFAVRRRVAVSA